MTFNNTYGYLYSTIAQAFTTYNNACNGIHIADSSKIISLDFIGECNANENFDYYITVGCITHNGSSVNLLWEKSYTLNNANADKYTYKLDINEYAPDNSQIIITYRKSNATVRYLYHCTTLTTKKNKINYGFNSHNYSTI